MIELYGDIFTCDIPVRCITTNGDVNSKGQAVMGRGVALQAKHFVPGIERMLAASIREFGNRTNIIAEQYGANGKLYTYVSLPVKSHWQEKADIDLIIRSVNELEILATIRDWPRVALPRPGCGNGGLEWHQVKRVIRDYLDDRFVIIEKNQ